MKLAIVGRTHHLIETANYLLAEGHTLGIVITASEGEDAKAFHELAQKHGVECIQEKKINSEPVLAKLRAANCDVGISINWVTIIHEPALKTCKHGFLNAHAGDLPKYRGNACVNWAILNDEQRIGLCIHQMTTELDAGDVFAREYFRLEPNTYVGEVIDWSAKRVPEMYVKALKMIEGGITPEPQSKNTAFALRAYPRRPEDSRIDWKQPASQIQRLVRASSSPYDGAYCSTEDSVKITVWTAEVFKPLSGHIAVPGQPIEAARHSNPIIACGEGFLMLTSISASDGSSDCQAKAMINRTVRRRLI